MAVKQRFGIKYPFTSENNEEIYIDLNDNFMDGVKSKVLHVLFTPKGQKLRDPEFGTDLIKYIFEPSDNLTFEELKRTLELQISRYVNNVSFKDISIHNDDDDEHSKIVIVKYSVITGKKETLTTVAVKI